MFQVTGNIHIHTTYSDGHGSIDEIALAAYKAGLDFIIVTDHNTLRGLPEEGYHQGVLVLVGSEINKKKNHYLALQVSEDIPVNDEEPQQVIDNVNSQKGIGFIAHPFEKGTPLINNGECFPWLDWGVTGFTGIEVWNWSSQWRDSFQSIPRSLYYSYFKPAGPIKGPCRESLALFDKLSQKRHIVAIAGTDAHAYPLRKGPIRRTMFPYQYQFRTINNCIVLEEPLSFQLAVAKQQIYSVLRRGRSFIVNSLIGTAAGFSFTATSDDREYHMGEVVPLGEVTGLHIKCPYYLKGKLKHRIFLNGRLLDEIKRCNVTVRVREPGVYRLEVLCNNKLWILTNPIYVNYS
ncbi:MAG: CehA/McbA family metallohydrolase [Dethiobacter sp.]|jgi:hypothetical protein|nr:CehA/McbA family metallohydrolase [Dethiobacter sp.]